MELYHVFYFLLATTVYASPRVKREDEEFECPSPSGIFANPSTCRKFYNCVSNHPYSSDCPSGLYFDDIKKHCTFKKEAQCGPIASTEAPSTTPDPNQSSKCNTRTCQLPTCFCSKDGTIIPKGLDPEETPQMVLLTFDDAVNFNNYDKYKRIFSEDRKNPNGCPIRGTFFISHDYTNYQMVEELYANGHEIAAHTITHKNGLENADYEEWVNEMVGMRKILKKFANVSESDVIGIRAPVLTPGRNPQYHMMEDFDFLYDSSMTVPPIRVPIWPYTLDHSIPHECKSGTCPTSTFPGLWELPLNSHYIQDFEGGHCNYLDQCVLHSHDPDDVFEWLMEDFERHYSNNRAPYIMPFHTNWFQMKTLENGFLKFLDYAINKRDVWFVTATQALLWITDEKPYSTKDIATYPGWDCKKRPEVAKACLPQAAESCELRHHVPGVGTDVRYMVTCADCPRQFPWIGDYRGLGGSTKDSYTPVKTSNTAEITEYDYDEN